VQLLTVLVQDLELRPKVVEDASEDAVAVGADELDATLAAELVDSSLGCVVRFGHDHDVVELQTPRLAGEGLRVIKWQG